MVSSKLSLYSLAIMLELWGRPFVFVFLEYIYLGSLIPHLLSEHPIGAWAQLVLLTAFS